MHWPTGNIAVLGYVEASAVSARSHRRRTCALLLRFVRFPSCLCALRARSALISALSPLRFVLTSR